MAAIVEGGASEGALQRVLQIEGSAPAVVYIGRSLQEGGDVGRAWFDRMMEITQSMVGELESIGLVRPTDDPVMRAVLLGSMDLGIVFLRPHIERLLGAAITDQAVVERWMRAEFDLLTHGLFLGPAAGDGDNDEGDGDGDGDGAAPSTDEEGSS
jgi:hypothetical protein